MDAVARQSIEVGREHRGEGLAFTGLHLGDIAHVKGRRTHQLDVEGPLAEGAMGRLPGRGERLRQEVVQGFAVGVALPELVGQRAQLRVRHIDEVGLDRVDLLADPLQLTQDSPFTCAKDLINYDWHFSSRSSADRLTSSTDG